MIQSHTGFDWVSNKIPTWNLYFKNISYALELGCFEGRFSNFIANNLQPNGILICVDSWKPYAEFSNIDMKKVEDCFDLNTKNLPVIKMKMSTVEAYPKLKDKTFDFIYIDAGHTYEDCTFDLTNYWPLLNKNGLLCVDDYENIYFPGVKKAVINFLNSLTTKYEILSSGDQIWIKKL